LIRLLVDQAQGHYPTMSGHKSRFALRFLPLGDLETGDIHFQLACC
ncbi:MAG: cell division protein ZapD, partial [Aeromonadaceae bacterium]